MIGIRCDRAGCPTELWGLNFDAVPEGWTVKDFGHGDHMDYCPNHSGLKATRFAIPEPQVFSCRHGERTDTPTAVYAGPIYVCRCCGFAYGSLNLEPRHGLCRYCAEKENTNG